jgi:hypothetical protein
MVRNLYIAKNIKFSDFTDLDLKQDSCDEKWDCAIKIFKQRFWQRYFNPINELTSMASKATSDDPSTFGFIILGTCFLLVETLAGFEDGRKSHDTKSKELCVKGLRKFNLRDESGICRIVKDDEAKKLYSIGRCALLHSAGTEGVQVTASGPSITKISDDEFKMNRTKFSCEVEEMYTGYLKELSNRENILLRDNFIIKMRFIAGK